MYSAAADGEAVNENVVAARVVLSLRAKTTLGTAESAIRTPIKFPESPLIAVVVGRLPEVPCMEITRPRLCKEEEAAVTFVSRAIPEPHWIQSEAAEPSIAAFVEIESP